MKTWPYKVNFQTLFTVLPFMLHFKFSINYFFYSRGLQLQDKIQPAVFTVTDS